jgi:ABC-type nickel/cobalt efflux system permease component RcnA
LTLSPGHLADTYQLFMPEVSAFGQLKLMDKNGDGVYSEDEKQAYLLTAAPKCLANFKVTLNGQPVVLKVVSAKADVAAGVGGLSTLKMEYRFEADLPALSGDGMQLHFSDDNFTGTPGWKEIQAVGDGGWRIVSAPPHPQSAIDALQNSADIVFATRGGGTAVMAPRVGPPPGLTSGGEKLAGLLGKGELSAHMMLVALVLAFGLGALHALTPGHGKTIVGAYLVGSRGTIPQAIFLGGVVTFTHTISVILLGVVCLVAFQNMVTERMYPWLGFVSGLLIAGMGAWLLIDRWGKSEHDHQHHDHDHEHEHSHGGVTHTHGGSTHSHAVPEKVTLWSLLALGISGGIVPCPDALVVLLSAVALHRIGLGLMVIVSFSFGLAAVLMAIGVVMVTAGQLLEKYYPKRSSIGRWTALTYGFIMVVGLSLAWQSLAQTGLFKG